MRGMTGDLVGLVPPPEEPDPTVEPLRGVLGAGAGAFDPVAPLADSLRAAASVAVWGSTDNGDLCLWVVPADGEALVPHRRSVHPGDGCVARALEDHPGGAEEAGRGRVRVSPETAADSRCQCAAEKRGERHAVVQVGARRYDR